MKAIRCLWLSIFLNDTIFNIQNILKTLYWQDYSKNSQRKLLFKRICSTDWLNCNSNQSTIAYKLKSVRQVTDVQARRQEYWSLLPKCKIRHEAKSQDKGCWKCQLGSSESHFDHNTHGSNRVKAENHS